MHLAVVNEKGGAGKTTTVVNLAAALAARGQRVLVVDLDGQASASTWLDVRAPDDGPTLLDALAGRAPIAGLLQRAPLAQLDVIPASSQLVGLEYALADVPRREAALRRALTPLRDAYHWILTDCPPSLGMAVLMALTAADAVLVPTEPTMLGLAGLAALMRTIDDVKARTNPALYVAGIVACRVRHTNLSADVLGQLRARFGPMLCRAVVPDSVRVAEAPSFGPLTSYAPSCPAALAYASLAGELVSRTRKGQR